VSSDDAALPRRSVDPGARPCFDVDHHGAGNAAALDVESSGLLGMSCGRWHFSISRSC